MHKLHFEYDKNNVDVSILRLSHLLDGREETQEKLDLFKFHDENSALDWEVVRQDGLIYPKWCTEELEILKNENPSVYNQIMDIGINYVPFEK